MADCLDAELLTKRCNMYGMMASDDGGGGSKIHRTIKAGGNGG